MCGKIKCKEMIIIEKAFYVIHFSMNGNRSYHFEALRYDYYILYRYHYYHIFANDFSAITHQFQTVKDANSNS